VNPAAGRTGWGETARGARSLQDPNDGTGGRGGLKKGGLQQLIQMGLGTIAGDIKEINLKDPKRTVVMELEANNFEDADGNPISYMDNEGYVDDASPNLGGLAVAGVVGAAALAGIYLTLSAL